MKNIINKINLILLLNITLFNILNSREANPIEKVSSKKLKNTMKSITNFNNLRIAVTSPAKILNMELCKDIKSYIKDYNNNIYNSYDRTKLIKKYIEYYSNNYLNEMLNFSEKFKTKFADHQNILNNILSMFNQKDFYFGKYTLNILNFLCLDILLNDKSNDPIIGKDLNYLLFNTDKKTLKKIRKNLELASKNINKFFILNQGDHIEPDEIIKYIKKNGFKKNLKFSNKHPESTSYLYNFILNSIKILELLYLTKGNINNTNSLIDVALELLIKNQNNNLNKNKNGEIDLDLKYKKLFELLEKKETADVTFMILFNAISYIDLVMTMKKMENDKKISFSYKEENESKDKELLISVNNCKHPSLINSKIRLNDDIKEYNIKPGKVTLIIGQSGSGKTTLQYSFFNNIQLADKFGFSVSEGIKFEGLNNYKKIVYLDYSKVLNIINELLNSNENEYENNNHYKNNNFSDGQKQIAALKYMANVITNFENNDVFFIVSLNEPAVNVPSDSFGLVGFYLGEIYGSKNCYTLINTHIKQIIKKMAIMSKENKNGNKNNSIEIEFKKMLVKEIDNGIFKSLFTYENVDYEEILKIKSISKSNEKEMEMGSADGGIDVVPLMEKSSTILLLIKDKIDEIIFN